MGDTVREQPEEAPLDVAGAMAAARLLLAAAEADATRLREDAVRYARQREQEAELLVAKARRVLSVAEERAAGIVVAARTQSRENGSQDWPTRMTPEAATASAVRIIVPRLPGSRMSSNATHIPLCVTAGA